MRTYSVNYYKTHNQKWQKDWKETGAYLDCMLLGVQVTTGLGFFLHLSRLVDSEDSDSLLSEKAVTLSCSATCQVRNIIICVTHLRTCYFHWQVATGT